MLFIHLAKIISNTLVDNLRDIEYHLNTGDFDSAHSKYESLLNKYSKICANNESLLFHTKYAQFLYESGRYHEIIVFYTDELNKFSKHGGSRSNKFVDELRVIFGKAKRCLSLSKDIQANCVYLSNESRFNKNALLAAVKKFFKKDKYKDMDVYLAKLNKYFKNDPMVRNFNIVSNFKTKKYGLGLRWLQIAGDNKNYKLFNEINLAFKNSSEEFKNKGDGPKYQEKLIELADKVYDAYLASTYAPNIYVHLQNDILKNLVSLFCGKEGVDKYAYRLVVQDSNDFNKKQYVKCLIEQDKFDEALKALESIDIADKEYVKRTRRDIKEKINKKKAKSSRRGGYGYNSGSYSRYNNHKNYNTGNRGVTENADNNDPKGFYKILKVPKNATDKEIKKSWRKLTRELDVDNHPNLSKEELKKMDNELMKVNEAYEVLRDPEKRKQYDSGLFSQNEQNIGGGPNVDINDIFEAFFGGGTRGREQHYFFNNDGFRGSQRTFFFY